MDTCHNQSNDWQTRLARFTTADPNSFISIQSRSIWNSKQPNTPDIKWLALSPMHSSIMVSGIKCFDSTCLITQRWPRSCWTVLQNVNHTEGFHPRITLNAQSLWVTVTCTTRFILQGGAKFSRRSQVILDRITSPRWPIRLNILGFTPVEVSWSYTIMHS